MVEIIITAWALDSYLDLNNRKIFSKKEYKENIRPDALLLKNYPTDPKFGNNKFWSIATGKSGNKINNGYKMKWHQIGDGKVQLRLSVGIFSEAFLCEAYVKKNEKYEKRKLARFKTMLQKISLGEYIENGRLS